MTSRTRWDAALTHYLTRQPQTLTSSPRYAAVTVLAPTRHPGTSVVVVPLTQFVDRGQ